MASPGLAVSPSVSICVHLWCLFSAYFPFSAVNSSRQLLKFNVGMTIVLAFPSALLSMGMGRAVGRVTPCAPFASKRPKTGAH